MGREQVPTVGSVQSALQWLIEAHQADAKALESAAAERAALIERIAALEANAEESAKRHAESIESLTAKLNSVEQNGRSAQTRLRNDISAEAKAAELQAQENREKDRADVAALDARLSEQLTSQAEAASTALADAISDLGSSRLAPLEELAKTTSKRLGEHSTAVEVQFMEVAETAGRQLEERAVVLEARLAQDNERLDELGQRIEDVKKSRHSPPPHTMGAGASNSARILRNSMRSGGCSRRLRSRRHCWRGPPGCGTPAGARTRGGAAVLSSSADDAMATVVR